MSNTYKNITLCPATFRFLPQTEYETAYTIYGIVLQEYTIGGADMAKRIYWFSHNGYGTHSRSKFVRNYKGKFWFIFFILYA
jgi:hypothetical protein